MSKKKHYFLAIPITSRKTNDLRALHDWMLENKDSIPKNLHKIVGELATSAETAKNNGFIYSDIEPID